MLRHIHHEGSSTLRVERSPIDENGTSAEGSDDKLARFKISWKCQGAGIVEKLFNHGKEV